MRSMEVSASAEVGGDMPSMAASAIPQPHTPKNLGRTVGSARASSGWALSM